jgi:hypothetical protein
MFRSVYRGSNEVKAALIINSPDSPEKETDKT